MLKFSAIILAHFFFALCVAESLRDPFSLPVMMNEEKLVVQHTQIETAEKKLEVKATQWEIIKQLEDGTTIIKKQDGSICKVKI